LGKRKKHTTATGRKSATESNRIPTWVWLAGGGILAVLLVAGLYYLGTVGSEIGNTIDGVVISPDPGAGHQEGDIHDDHEVPTGGLHNSEWQQCGIYEEPIREENVVHSMEHGAVWLAYRPDLSADQVETLRELVRTERSQSREPLIVLAPKPELEVPIVASAWRVQLELDHAEDERLQAFVDQYQRGPFTPEPGANCVEGVGEPLS
jgi:hypothetical protein